VIFSCTLRARTHIHLVLVVVVDVFVGNVQLLGKGRADVVTLVTGHSPIPPPDTCPVA